ncbi:hypothetical protein RhiJN_21178 [Ceratobasidium sp. AG-Ba]|nr:hypothetical protein RhiJN_21178 [Ceratobasidium sp. AG-Ba]
MTSPLPAGSSNIHIRSSPLQLSTVLDGDEETPPTSQVARPKQSDPSVKESTSSRSTIPFPSEPVGHSDHSNDDSPDGMAVVIQSLRNLVQSSPPSIDMHEEPPAESSTPTPPVRPPLSRKKSPVDTRLRSMSNPLKPSLSQVDSLSSTRYEGGPKRVSFDHVSSGPTESMQNLATALQTVKHPLPIRNALAQNSPHRTPRASRTPTKGFSSPGTRSRSRSTSPRRFWPLFRTQSPGEPWEPKDPYRLRLKLDELRRRRETIQRCWDQILRQVYRHFLLRLPSVYFTRVSKVFEEAELSRVEVQKMIDASKRARTRRIRTERRRKSLEHVQSQFQGNGTQPSTSAPQREAPAHRTIDLGAIDPTDFFPNDREWTTPLVSPSLQRFKQSWDDFMDSLNKEWKTLNVVSALLLSAILTVFQVDGSNEPVLRTAALIALVCALWSLTFGCIYIVRFSTMRSMHKASRWAEEAQRHSTGIWWNVWVFLSLPSVFLAWSVISFCVAVLAFSWTTGTVTPPSPISDKAAIGPRLAITFVFLLGLVYFYKVVRTLRKYADPLPRNWALHSPPPLTVSNERDSDDVPELDLERGEEFALGTVKDMADRAAAEEKTWIERGRGLIRGLNVGKQG